MRINTILDAGTNVLVTAKPIDTFNKKWSLSKNLNMSVSFFNRFGVIVMLKDEPNEETDPKFREHICNEF